MFLKVCNFVCNRSENYVSLFEDSCAFSAVYRIVLDGFYCAFLQNILQSFATILVWLVSLDKK